MTYHGIRNQTWCLTVLVLVFMLTVVACGTTAPAAPPATDRPQATPTQPAATTSLQVGQGAVGAASPTATSAPVATKAPVVVETPKNKVTMLRVARGVSDYESNDPVSGRADLTFLLPMYEGLVQFDQFTDSQPMLSTEWKTEDGFKTWSFKLRDGVQFHDGWGEVTAKDVVHSMGQERRDDHHDSRRKTWRKLIDKIDMPAGPDGDEVVFYLTKAEPIMTTYMSTNYTTVIRSKKHWDEAGGKLDAEWAPNEVGVKAMHDDPVGTGPYQFVERREAQSIRYEGLDYTHWRITPDFQDLQINFVPESSTRLAMLMADEVHAAEIPRDIQKGAQDKGKKLITSTTPAIRLVGFFGGNFVSSRPEFDKTSPLANPKVREAMNRAINREEINNIFFRGRAEKMMQTHSHPKFPGWEDAWPGRFEEAYGFDPERAKELLAEAGYPNGFSMIQKSYPRPGLPEMHDIGELVNGYWKDIGITAKYEPGERSVTRALQRAYKTTDLVWMHTGSFTEPTRAIYVYHYDPSTFHGFDDDFFSQKYEELEVAGSYELRDDLIREMGEHCWTIYCTIPLFWVPFEFMVDPAVISEWQTPGVFSFRDYESVKAAK